VILFLSGETWVRLYLSQASVHDLMESRELEIGRGTTEEANELMSMFDKHQPEKAVLVAPHHYD